MTCRPAAWCLILAVTAFAQIGAVQGTMAAPPPPHHDAKIDYDPATQRLSVVDRISVKGRDRLSLSWAPWLRLVDLKVDGQPAPTEAQTGRRDLKLSGPDRHVIEATLHGTVPAIPAAKRGAPTGAPSGGAMAGSVGLYLPGYGGWFADTGDETVTFTLRTAMALPFRAVATGHLVKDGDDGKIHRATISAPRPMEPPSLFAGPYRIAETQSDGVRIRTYFHDDLSDLAGDYLEQTAKFLRRYTAEIGPYPYKDFHVISAPLPVGLGFPSLTYVGRRVLPLPFMRGRSLAHEVLHSWWGNGVAVDYARGNWSEGLTTYMADYALARDEGAEAARLMRLAWLRDFAALPAARDHPVIAFTGKRHQASQVVGYNKVAFIFHMLRQEVGEATFQAALQRFWQIHRFKTASWRDIETAFSEAAKRDLSWFFRQWLQRPGAPTVELADLALDPGGPPYRVIIRLRQNSPAFRLNVPIVVETNAGPTHATAEMTTTGHAAVIEVAERPTRVRVDPGFDLFRRLLPGESPPILRDVTLASTTRTAIVSPGEAVHRAGRQLAGRMMDSRTTFLPSGTLPPDDRPALIIGLEHDVNRVLRDLGLSPPAPLPDGDARAWAARRANGTPVIVVSAVDETALLALLRPLPHYGRRSFVAFEKGRAVHKGIWPVLQTPLSRSLPK